MFETKYKKIKFTEKRKVIRMLEQAKQKFKGAKGDEETQALQKSMKDLRDKLTYINHFPPT